MPVLLGAQARLLAALPSLRLLDWQRMSTGTLLGRKCQVLPLLPHADPRAAPLA